MAVNAAQTQGLAFTLLNNTFTVSTAIQGGFQQSANASTARCWVEGAFTGTAVFEESFDGGLTWYPSQYCIADASPTSFSNAVTSAGSYTIVLIGVSNIRLRVSSVGTGTATATFVLLNQSFSISTGGSGGGGGGGAVTVTSGSISVTNTPTVSIPSTTQLGINSFGGLGALQSVPAGSGNGTALGTLPTGALGFQLYLNPGDTVSGTFATSAPVSAPANVYTYVGPNGPGVTPEYLSGGNMFYVTQTVGSPQFRWI